MLTLEDYTTLKEQLYKNEIALENAKSLVLAAAKEGKPSWQTKDWKERRSEMLKDCCEICGSKEVLTLQHLSHPKKYGEYERSVTSRYAKEEIVTKGFIDKDDLEEYISAKYNYEPIPLCPICGNRKPNIRAQKAPKYLCTSCRCEFDYPVYISASNLIEVCYQNVDAIEWRDKCFVSKDKWKNHHSLKDVKYWMLRESAKGRNDEKINREALLLYLDDNIKYLSFVDTITACRKCTFSFDLYNMDLCPKCRTKYKEIKYPTCIQCLPEDKRKAVMAKIEFGKSLGSMHKNLGID